MNPLGRERQFPSELTQLVTIGHQIGKVFDCLPLRYGNRDRVNFEGSGHLRVAQLGLRFSERCPRVLQERGMSSAQRVPVEPGLSVASKTGPPDPKYGKDNSPWIVQGNGVEDWLKKLNKQCGAK